MSRRALRTAMCHPRITTHEVDDARGVRRIADRVARVSDAARDRDRSDLVERAARIATGDHPLALHRARISPSRAHLVARRARGIRAMDLPHRTDAAEAEH